MAVAGLIEKEGGVSASQEIGPSVSAKMVLALRSLPPLVSGALLVALLVLIGWVDRLSGAEVSVFLLYALPISLSVSVHGTRVGAAAALLSALTWLVSNWTTHLHTTEAGYLMGMINRLFYFGVVVVAVSAVRKKQQADAARIQALEDQHRLERELVRVSEHEQQRIGQDLHDGICQHLAAIGCSVRMLADDLQDKDLPEFQDAAMIESAIQEVIVGTRDLARGICPVHVDRVGLPAALAELAKAVSRLTGTEVVASMCEDEFVFEPKIATHLYRIAQEAVGNALRHGRPTQVSIVMEALPGPALEIRIEDNGSGMEFPLDQQRQGLGLRTMHYRAEQAGGRLKIRPRPGKGTVVSCQVSMPGVIAGEKKSHENPRSKT